MGRTKLFLLMYIKRLGEDETGTFEYNMYFSFIPSANLTCNSQLHITILQLSRIFKVHLTPFEIELKWHKYTQIELNTKAAEVQNM